MNPPRSITPVELVNYQNWCRELRRSAQDFSEHAGDLCEPPFERPVTLELKLAGQARLARLSADHLNATYDRLSRDIFPRSLKRAVDSFTLRLDELLQRWGWSFILADDSSEQVQARINSYDHEKLTPLLRHALAWRNMPGVEPHTNGDRLADEAESRGLEPIELSPGTTAEEAERQTGQLHAEWFQGSALGESRPQFDYEERNQLEDLAYRLKSEIDASERAINFRLEELRQRLAETHDATPTDCSKVIAASREFVRTCREWSNYENRTPPTGWTAIQKILHGKAVELNSAISACCGRMEDSASAYFGRLKADFEQIVGNGHPSGPDRYSWGLRSQLNPDLLIDSFNQSGNSGLGVFGDFRHRPFSFQHGVVESLRNLEESADRFEEACGLRPNNPDENLAPDTQRVDDQRPPAQDDDYFRPASPAKSSELSPTSAVSSGSSAGEEAGRTDDLTEFQIDILYHLTKYEHTSFSHRCTRKEIVRGTKGPRRSVKARDVDIAFPLLRGRGFIEARQGSGTWITPKGIEAAKKLRPELNAD